MKTKLFFLLSVLFLSLGASAQWTQRANFPGGARARSVAFTIDNKIYVMGGYTSSGAVLKDVWEYDIATDTWLQKNDFPGPERYGAVSFVINDFGYIATGANDFGYLDDLWLYDPASDHWIQNVGLPATSPQRENERKEAFAFTIGSKAYLGGGEGFVYGGNSTSNYAFYDLWEYDPATNLWTKKSDIPDFLGRNMSIAGSFNGKGYVGLGCDVFQTTAHPSFWEYDPASDSWAAKADFPSVNTTDAGSFVLDSDLYVVGGVKFNPVALTSHVYKYHIPSDTWTPMSNNFSGASIAGEFAVSTGTSAFVGTGFNNFLVPRSDMWEFPSTATTGIDENNFPSAMNAQVYPNPANTFISVLSEKPISSTEVYDISGNKLLTQKDASNNINIEKLLAGVYSVKFIFRDGSVEYYKFLKMD